jgi:heavy metal sensor kinase
MLSSVRIRLTLWYTGALAVVLIALAVAGYFLFQENYRRRVDATLSDISDAFSATLHAEMADGGSLDAAADRAIAEHHFRDDAFVLIDASGRILKTSSWPQSDGREGKESPQPLESESFQRIVQRAAEGRVFGNVRVSGERFRGFAQTLNAGGQTLTLVALESFERQEALLEDIAQTFGVIVPIAILLAFGGGYFLARKSLAPVVSMSAQAGRIGAANLHERLRVANERDELGLLAASFNQLLDRLAESMEQQRRFMADASHELRTPVAILRGEADVALSQPVRTPEDYRESLSILRDEARRLTELVENLFTLARADAGQYPLTLRNRSLREVLEECVRATRTLAQAKRITISCHADGELPVAADEALLQRMLLNLIDNAIKYTPEGGSVDIHAARKGAEYSVVFADNGPGIPAELQPRVFERFFRANPARTHEESEAGGAGLGLAIARWIAEAHHGSIELTRSTPAGTVFTVMLPAQSS